MPSLVKSVIPASVGIAVVEALIAILLYVADPLGILPQKALSLDHFAAWWTQHDYPAKASDRLAVVLIDEESLKSWETDWPLPYAQSASLVNRLACAGASAVFFDYGVSRQFLDLEKDVGSRTLRDAVLDSSNSLPICDNGKPPKRIAVYFGKTPGLDSPLSAELTRTGHTVSMAADTSDDHYTLIIPPEAGAAEQTRVEYAPAFQLWKQHCSDKASADPACAPIHPTEPLALRWNGNLSLQQHLISDVDGCRPNLPFWRRAAVLLGYWTYTVEKSEYFQSCPPLLTLSARDLYRDYGYISAHHGDPAKLVEGRTVFVGVNLRGLNDHVASPVHQELPGVYKHAMALDNLITFGNHYPKVPSDAMRLLSIAVYFFLIRILAALAPKNVATGWWHFGALALTTAGCAMMFRLFDWSASIWLAAVPYHFGSEILRVVGRFLHLPEQTK